MSERDAPDAPAVVVGLMSGTSLDGVSAAVARVGGTPVLAELLAFVQRPYTSAQRARVERAMAGATAAEYAALDVALGEWLADAAIAAIAEAGVPRNEIAALGAFSGWISWVKRY